MDFVRSAMRVMGGVGLLCCVGVSAMTVIAPSAGAASASGCSGTARSLSKSDIQLDVANAPGAGATQATPLHVDPQGSVDYSGSSDSVLTNGSWQLSVSGLPIQLNGSFVNADHATSAKGTADVNSYVGGLSWLLAGTYKVHLLAKGQSGATCVVDAYVQFTTAPAKTVLFWGGLLFLILALLLLFFGQPEPLMNALSDE
jgi:hypothetical protein